jgi:hypothetical protein
VSQEEGERKASPRNRMGRRLGEMFLDASSRQLKWKRSGLKSREGINVNWRSSYVHACHMLWTADVVGPLRWHSYVLKKIR